jgi:hypothetical protein
MSPGVVDKEWSTHCIDIIRKKNFAAEIIVLLANRIFKRSENGSVLQNGVKYIRKVLSPHQNNNFQ